MNNSIVYVDNFSNFHFYLNLAMHANCFKFHFVVFSEERYEACIEAGIDCDLIRWRLGGESSRSTSVDLHFDIAIANDRLLRFIPRRAAKAILVRYLQQFEQVLDKVKPCLVVGEISWAVEYMFYLASEARGIRYRHILNLPLEKVRVVAFDAEHSMSSLAECTGSPAIQGPEISYAFLCGKVKQFNSKRRRDRQVRSSSDYREKKVLWVLSSMHYWSSKLLYGTAYKLLSRPLTSIHYDSRKIIVYFPLHVQPESTPDYVSPYYSDQLGLLRRISIQLGDECIILVKEHPNNFSPRSIAKFLGSSRCSNIVYVRSEVRAQALVEACDVVMTVAGTTALEAANIGKPSITFSNIFYNHFNGIFDGRSALDAGTLKSFLSRRLGQPVDHDVIEKLKEFGVQGFMHDPRIVEKVVDRANLNAVTELLQGVCEREA
jgi:hypothetical protein